MNRVISVFTWLIAVLAAMPIAAVAAEPASGLLLGAETGMEIFAADAYATLALNASARSEHAKLGLWAPLRLRVFDGNDSGQPTPGLRREDWDEWSDRLRVLRYLDIDWAQGRVHAGELVGVTIGHGTIVDRYYNDLDFDHHHTGASASVDQGAWGAEAMVSDLLLWDLGALRLFGRPLTGSSSRIWRTLTIGTTAVADAAYRGNALLDLGHARSDPMFFAIGLDAALTVWQRESSSLVWYLDGSTRPTSHAALPDKGTLASGLLAEIPMRQALLRLRGQASWSSSLDVPQLIDTFHGLTREDPHGSAFATQAPGGLGGLLRVDVQSGSARVVVATDWRPGDGAGLFAWLVLQPTDALSLRAFAGQRHLDSWRAFGQRDGPLVQASAHYRVQGPWFAALSLGRSYHTVLERGQSRLRPDLAIAAVVGADLGL